MLWRLVNFLCFQAGWFACVLGAANGRPHIGPAVVGGWVVVHLYFSRSRRSELIVLVAAALLGCAADSILTLAGRLQFDDISGVPLTVPLWMVALWVNLATTLGASLCFLRGRFFLALILGAIGGPLAYLAGEAAGALRLGGPVNWSLIAIGLEWAVAMPTLVAIDHAARRLTGYASTSLLRCGPVSASASHSNPPRPNETEEP